MRLSDSIESFIKTLITQEEPEVELKRNELAEYFGCAPSQINYVIMSRFTPERGYLTESRRGGGGFIRIVKKPLQRNEFLASVIEGISAYPDESECKAILRALAAQNVIAPHDLELLAVALAPASLSPISSKAEQAAVRGILMRRLLTSLMQ